MADESPGRKTMRGLAIIIVNYNTRGILRECVAAAIASVEGIDAEIIVVDNNSSDGSAEMVKSTFREVRVLENKENVGFAKAMNAGIRNCPAGKYLLLNTDAFLYPQAVTGMMAFLDSRNDVGIVSPNLVNNDGSDQGMERRFPSGWAILFGRKSLLTKIFPNNRFSRRYLSARVGASDEPFEVDWVAAACMMFKREVIDTAGMLDEDFWMYWEDAELCHRAKKRGWRVYSLPSMQVTHYEGASSAAKNKKLLIEFHRSVLLYYKKQYSRGRWDPLYPPLVVVIWTRCLFLLLINQVRAFRASRSRAKEIATKRHAGTP